MSDTDNMRREFEAKFCPDSKDRANWMRTDRRGNYCNPAMQSAWQGYQAGRAAADKRNADLLLALHDIWKTANIAANQGDIFKWEMALSEVSAKASKYAAAKEFLAYTPTAKGAGAL